MGKYCSYYSRKLPSGKIAHYYRKKDLRTGLWERKACPDHVKTKRDAETFVMMEDTKLTKLAMSEDYGITIPTLDQKVLTLKALLDWDNERADIMIKTRITEKSQAKQLLELLPADLKVCDMTSGMIDEYKKQRTKEGKAARTINIQLQMLRAAINRAVDKGKLSRVPCKIESVPEPKQTGNTVRALTQKEAAALLETVLKHDKDLEPEKYKNPDSKAKRAAKQTLHDTFSVLLYSGLRKGEVFRMRWEDIDLEHGLLTVTSYKRGGAGSAHTDTIPLSPVVLDILKRRHTEQNPDARNLVFGIEPESRRAIRNGSTPEKRGTVCGEEVFEDYRLLDKLKRYAKLAKIKWHKELRIHDLRHTFCTELARSVPLVVVKDLARHTVIQTTLRYVHPSHEDKRKALSGLAFTANVVDVAPCSQETTPSPEAVAQNEHTDEAEVAQAQ